MDAASDPQKLRGLIEELMDFCEPVAANIGESQNLALARQILVEEPGYSQQPEAYGKKHSMRAVSEYLTSQLLNPLSPGTQPAGA